MDYPEVQLFTDTTSTEPEVGLKTNHPRIITDLIKRFDTAKELRSSNLSISGGFAKARSLPA
ncbi:MULTISPECIES: hypothetical protein [Cyanophyceae]|uniref:hypothetical protein n=1 Tax=Cyanophyceae TaxID=3028117 RepID=UPI0016895076|nr:hypothetical protein [Trichocoleus sp. FACHB-40]